MANHRQLLAVSTSSASISIAVIRGLTGIEVEWPLLRDVASSPIVGFTVESAVGSRAGWMTGLIADDRDRDRVGKELLAYGERVQKSVFEIVVRHPGELGVLRTTLAPLLEDGDALRFYRLCANCRSASVGVRRNGLADFLAAVIV